MEHPYKSLPERAFWRPAVKERSMYEIDDLWDPKFPIDKGSPVVTFGSCFAQHIGRALRHRGFNWFVAEQCPPHMSEASQEKFNFGIFSCRTGNIYTSSLLRQWTAWALDRSTPPEEAWGTDGAVYDPFRPAIEPGGFATRDEMVKSRKVALQAFKTCIIQAKYFVFTLGLTESWFDTAGNYEYPMCPGTVAGTFHSDRHHFANQDYDRVRDELCIAMSDMRSVNPDLKFILTVSPVPLAATNSGQHVALATMYSKSVLRSVAGTMVRDFDYVDYFPSYEIINSPIFRGSFFKPDQRNVTEFGVNFVMGHLFGALEKKFGSSAPVEIRATDAMPHKAEVCEEEMLDAFS